MGRNKLLIGGIVVVAAIVIVYFAFLYPPVSREDTSGAIGAAKKYRSEQITDRDVMLQDEENAAVAALAAMSSEEKAAFFEKTTAELQGRALSSASPEVVAALVERAGKDILAQLGKTAPAQQVVDMFARLPKPAQDATLQRMHLTAQAFAKLPLEERAKNILAKASNPDIAAMVKAANMQERRDILVNCKDLALKGEFVNLLPRADRADLMGLASASIRTEFDAATKAMMESERASRPRD